MPVCIFCQIDLEVQAADGGALLHDTLMCITQAPTCRLPVKGKLPTLELYTTLDRTMEENTYIMERSLDGMDFAAAAYFRCVHHLPGTAPIH